MSAVIMQYYDDPETTQIPVPGLVGLIAGAAVLLVMLLTRGDVTLIGWTELAIAALLAVIVGGLSALIMRLADWQQDRGKATISPIAADVYSQAAVDIADAVWDESLRHDEPTDPPGAADFVMIHLAGRPINVSPSMAEAIEIVREARLDGKLLQVSQRRLHDEAGIDRYGSLGSDLIELFFLQGLLKRSGQVYEWTDKGVTYFPIAPLPGDQDFE